MKTIVPASKVFAKQICSGNENLRVENYWRGLTPQNSIFTRLLQIETVIGKDFSGWQFRCLKIKLIGQSKPKYQLVTTNDSPYELSSLV